MKPRLLCLLSIIIFCEIFLSCCSKAYYNTMEKMGVHKRDILVDLVEKAQSSREEAKKEFASALERFSSVASFKGGDLEAKYN